ncbi:MAG: hypothetical protein K9J16_16885 [Melioribacteraceae bacterium]|nr:hypothetical protein [Melioribacteraceae bacterium]MCF8356511.1 hypothetical protein [Melioribacteraceae bacterium]MCF8396121.1 hypothetical protein [Melioribacteraceae bacterium]MCF8420954.1 hypothetical protein [Melioribacteraceae bacterium]
MKKLEKYIIPTLILVVVVLVYLVYFSPIKGLSSFNDVDPNAHVQKSLAVRLVIEDGIDRSSVPGKTIFFAEDRDGRKSRISAPNDAIPPGLENAETVNILGHFHGTTFDAVEVEME